MLMNDLLFPLQTIKEKESSIDILIEEFAKEVEQEFIHLHGILQNTERLFLVEAIELYKNSKKPFIEARERTITYIDNGQVSIV